MRKYILFYSNDPEPSYPNKIKREAKTTMVQTQATEENGEKLKQMTRQVTAEEQQASCG